MLMEADDQETARLSAALHGRKLLRCIDLVQRVEAETPRRNKEAPHKHRGRVMLTVGKVEAGLKSWASGNSNGRARVLLDRYSRWPYKRYQDSDTPLNRILVRSGAGRLLDMADFSSLIAATQPFEISRAYVFRDDKAAENVVENIIRTQSRRGNR